MNQRGALLALVTFHTCPTFMLCDHVMLTVDFLPRDTSNAVITGTISYYSTYPVTVFDFCFVVDPSSSCVTFVVVVLVSCTGGG
jgi:hypothetical protein